MGTEAFANELMNGETLSQNSISISEVSHESCSIVEEKNVAVLSESSILEANQEPSIGPVTPAPSRENREQNHVFSSPLTMVSSPPKAPSFSSAWCNLPTSPDGNSSETPKESIFDSFAPGPDKVMLAPHHRKYRAESRTHVVRRLNFTCVTNLVRDITHESDKETISDEEHLFEIVYSTILDVIVSEQTKELVDKFPTSVSDSDGFRTPKSASRLSGVAQTCPAAPLKCTNKYRNIDKEICRKLEF